mgnify:CR=1 FL=1
MPRDRRPRPAGDADRHAPRQLSDRRAFARRFRRVRDTWSVPVAAVPAGAPAGNIHRVTLAYTMENADATRKFYTGMLGINLTGSATYSKDATLMQLYGAATGTEFRTLSGELPGATPTAVEFTEFKGVPRTKFHLRVRDPGAPAMAIQVNELRPTIATMKANGVNVLSTNQEIVDFGGGTFTIFVEDPNGMNLEVFERNPPQGKGKQGK